MLQITRSIQYTNIRFVPKTDAHICLSTLLYRQDLE